MGLFDPTIKAGVLKSLTLGVSPFLDQLFHGVFYSRVLPRVFWQSTWSLALSVSKTAKAIDELLAPRRAEDPRTGSRRNFRGLETTPAKKNTLITSWKSNMELPPKKKTMLKGNFIFQSNHQFFSDMLVFMGYILQDQHFEPQTWRRMEDYFLLQFGDFQVNHVNFQGRTLPDTNRKNTWNLGLGLFQERILLVLGRVA